MPSLMRRCSWCETWHDKDKVQRCIECTAFWCKDCLKYRMEDQGCKGCYAVKVFELFKERKFIQ